MAEMLVTITSRHDEVAVSLRERAEAVLLRLSRLAHRPERAQVEFDLAHQRHTAEIRLHAARNAVYVSAAEADDHRTALDRAAAKLRRQLDKKPASRRRAGPRKGD
jgi:ribosomal subunit interface protein